MIFITTLQPLTTTSVIVERSSQLSDGAIAAIVLIVTLVTVISIVVVLVITVVFARQRSRRNKYILDNIADTSRVTNTYQAVDELGGPVDDKQPLDQTDICLQEKSESLVLPSTAYIESNPAALEDNQEIKKADKDTSM
jgi:cytoskeletal protein RodZ